MNSEGTDMVLAAESAAKRYSRMASALVACGLLLFFASTHYASSRLAQMEASLKQKRDEEAVLSARVENLVKQDGLLINQIQSQARLLQETSAAIAEKTRLFKEISTQAKANAPLDQPTIERIKTQVDKAKSQEQSLENAVAKAQTALLPRVYLHIADEGQRPLAKDIQSFLGGDEFAAPGVQNVGGKGYIPDTVEVRYLPDPEDKETSQSVLNILRDQFHITNARISYTEKGPRDRPGHIEIWFSRSIQRKQ